MNDDDIHMKPEWQASIDLGNKWMRDMAQAQADAYNLLCLPKEMLSCPSASPAVTPSNPAMMSPTHTPESSIITTATLTVADSDGTAISIPAEKVTPLVRVIQ